MTITAMSPDGVALAFPDEIDPAVMQTAIKNYLAAPSGNSEGGATAPPAAASAAAPAPADPNHQNSLGQDFQGGAYALPHSLSRTASAIGGIANRNGYTGVGEAANTAAGWLDGAANAIGDAPATANSDVGATLKDPNATLGDTGSALLHAGARAAAPTFAALAVGAVPGAGPYLAGALGSAQSLGETADARAANNGHAGDTRTEDVVGAIPSAVGGALAGVGIGGGIGRGIENVAGRTAVKAGVDFAAGAGGDAANQLGATVGTNAGAQLDPYQSLGAGMSQVGVGKAIEAPQLAREGVGAVSNNIASRLVEQPKDINHAIAIDQANQAIQDAQAAAPGEKSATTLANSAKSEVKMNIADTFSSLAEKFPEDIDRSDKLNFKEALNQALRHNNSIGDSANPHVQTLLDQLAALKLPPEALEPVIRGLRTLDVLSNASFMNQTTGPGRVLGGALAQGAEIGGAFMAGGPVAAAAPIGAMFTQAGRNAMAMPGTMLGGIADRIMGTAVPKAQLQLAAAQRMIAKAKAGTPGNPVADLQAVRDVADSLGIPQPTPDGPITPIQPVDLNARMAAQAAQEKAVRDAAWQKSQAQQAKAPGDLPNTAEVRSPISALNAAFPEPNSAASRDYQNGSTLPHQGEDPMRKAPTQNPADINSVPEEGDLAAQQASIQAADAAARQRVADFLNRKANTKADAQTVAGKAQAKVDNLVHRNATNLAAGDIPAAGDSTEHVAAAVQALRDRQRVENLAASASDDLHGRIATGSPAGDLTQPIAGQQGFRKAPEPREPPAPAPQQATAPPPAPPPAQAPTPVAAPLVQSPPSGGMPAAMHAAMRNEPAGNGRPNEVFQHNALLPKPTIGQVQDANVAAHGQESGDWMNTTEDHSRIPRAALLKTQQHMLNNGFTLDPAFDPRTHRDGAPESGSGSGTILDADRWHEAANQYMDRTARTLDIVRPHDETAAAVGLLEKVAATEEVADKRRIFNAGMAQLSPSLRLLIQNSLRSTQHSKFLTHGKKT